jgi:signal transduction histidine kinase/DNA-binding NarL/FixJ family response regulator
MQPPPASRPRTVLVVEDDDDTRSAMVQLLRAEGYRVLQAGSGAEASRQLALSRPPPEFVFLDLGLPDMSGQQWLARTVRLPAASALRICLVTGDDRHVGGIPETANVVSWLPKPFEPEALLAAVYGSAAVAPIEDSGLYRNPRPGLPEPAAPPHNRRFASGTRRLSTLLALASEVLASSLDVEGPIRETLGLIVPRLADWCALDCPAGGTSPASPGLLLTAHFDPQRALLLQDAAQRAAGLGIVPLVGEVLRDGQPRLFSDTTNLPASALLHDDSHAELMRRVGLGALLIAPLSTRGQVFGTLTLGLCHAARGFTPSHVDTAIDLAHRIALTVDNGRLYLRMQQAVRAREELLAMVSHDLRTPLSAITTSVATLQRASDWSATHFQSVAEAIRRNADRMETMIRDLLDFSQLEAGRLRVELRLEPLGDLVRSAIEAARPLARSHDLRLEIEAEATWITASCDRDRVSQILANLIDNALKFTPPRGRIWVRLWRSGSDAIISVSDTGKGIAAEELPHVFDAYWQGPDDGLGRARRSVGLGLYIARGLAEAQGGRLWAESAPERGSTFHFSLPL